MKRPSRGATQFYAVDAGRRLPARRRRASRSRARSTRRTPRTTSSRARYFPDASPRGRRRAVLVLPQWNSDAEGHVGLCRLLNRFGIIGAAPEPAVPRRAHAARAHAAPTTSSAPTSDGRRRSAARRCSTRGGRSPGCTRGLRVDRHPRHQPRLVPVDADDGARAAGQRRRAQPHLAVLRRRRLGRPVDDARARDARRQRRRSTSCGGCGCRSARCPSSIGCAAATILLVYARYDLTFPVDLSRMLVDEFRAARHRRTS